MSPTGAGESRLALAPRRLTALYTAGSACRHKGLQKLKRRSLWHRAMQPQEIRCTSFPTNRDAHPDLWLLAVSGDQRVEGGPLHVLRLHMDQSTRFQCDW